LGGERDPKRSLKAVLRRRKMALPRGSPGRDGDRGVAEPIHWVRMLFAPGKRGGTP